MNAEKSQLFADGLTLIRAFCEANDLSMPGVDLVPPAQWPYRPCAYYRPQTIKICIEKTSVIGRAGMSWSYPGYVADRTPYGVLAHELGHHADWTISKRKGVYFGDASQMMFHAAHEKRISSYAPNFAEWFAEMFRVFVTNPDLLRILRPRTYGLIGEHFTPIEYRSWGAVLHDAPERTREATKIKVLDALRGKNCHANTV